MRHFDPQILPHSHKDKQTTATAFRADLKDFHGVDARSLTPKTKLDEFWKLETAGLFAHLHANKIRIKESDEEKIRSRFLKARDKLTSLDLQIAFTDTLIDQIVYRLYGLTEAEIKIVEEASNPAPKATHGTSHDVSSGGEVIL